MRRKLMIVGCVALMLSIALLTVQSDSRARTVREVEPAPAGMTDLNSLEPLKQAFQRDRGTVRLVALLSPI